MLLRTLFVLLMLGVVGETIVQSAFALTRTLIARRAERAVDAGYQRALASLENAAASALASGADPRALVVPSPSPAATCLPKAGAQNGCALTVVATVHVATATPDPVGTPAAPVCGEQNACVLNAQRNDLVSEGRILASIEITATDANGARVLDRTRAVRLRTFRQAPYVVVAGARDLTNATIANDAVEGDDGGRVDSGSTLINVEYRSSACPACPPISANVWKNAAANTTDAPDPNWPH